MRKKSTPPALVTKREFNHTTSMLCDELDALRIDIQKQIKIGLDQSSVAAICESHNALNVRISKIEEYLLLSLKQSEALLDMRKGYDHRQSQSNKFVG